MGRPLFDPRGSGGRDDYRDFWERLGIDGGGLPIHFPMGVDQRGRGPESPNPHHVVCWCGDTACPLTQAFQDARLTAVKNIRVSWGAE